MIEVLEKEDTGERKTTMEDVMCIVELAVRVNGLGKRNSKRNPDNNYPTVFVDFCGHVASMEVRVFENGWPGGDVATRAFNFSTCGFFDTEKYKCYKKYMEGLIELVEKESSEAATSKDSVTKN